MSIFLTYEEDQLTEKTIGWLSNSLKILNGLLILLLLVQFFFVFKATQQCYSVYGVTQSGQRHKTDSISCPSNEIPMIFQRNV